MSPERAGRSRRLVAWAVAFAAVFTVVAVVLGTLGRDGGTDGDGAGAPPSTFPSEEGVPLARPGEQADPAALWLFGFDTLRLDVGDLAHRSRLGRSAFGTVLGTDGRVLLFEPETGQAGVLDATTNELRELPSVPVTQGITAEEVPVQAWTGSRWWVVTGPGRLRPVDPDTGEMGAEVDLGVAGADATRVVAGAGGLVAVVAGDEGVVAVRVDAGGDVVGRRVVPDAPRGVVAVLADGPRTWIVGARRAVAVDGSTLARDAEVALPLTAAAAVVDGGLWVVPPTGDRVLRVDPADGAVTDRVGVLREPRDTLRQPTLLVAGRGSLWLLTVLGETPQDHAVGVARIDPEMGEVLGQFRVGSDLFIGSLAVS